MFPVPAPVVRTMSTLDIALSLGWDLIEDKAEIEVGAPLPEGIVWRAPDAPSPLSRKAKAAAKKKAKAST